MLRVTGWAVLVCVLAAAVVPAGAQDPADDAQKAQSRLLARRAARVDAIRRLAERIKGLKITSKTTVKDFVATEDVIDTALVASLNGMKETKIQYTEDGACEVTMEIKLETVIQTLETIHKAYYKGDQVQYRDFQKMTETNQVKILRETGAGAPADEEALAEAPLVPPPPGQAEANIGGAPKKVKDFWKERVTARGRIMAERAARLDAMRKLAERLGGVYITANTTVRDFAATDDQVRGLTQMLLQGAREIGKRYHDDELIVEVEMQVKLRTVYSTLKTWSQGNYKGDQAKLKTLEELILKSRDRVIREIGMGVPMKYLRAKPKPFEQAAMDLAAKAPTWIAQKLLAVGNGALDPDNPNKAQAKLMALRAAEIDARRKLAEQIDGLQITGQTTVRDFATENDDIQTSLLAFQQGAYVVEGSQKVGDDGAARVAVEIELKPLWNSVLYYQKKLAIKIK